MAHAILLIFCPDRRGITAAVTGFVYAHNGNIVHADQHIDAEAGVFFMRIEWSLDGFKLERKNIESAFDKIAKKFRMSWELHFSHERPRVAVFVSKHLHCLYDLLMRYRAGQYPCDIPVVISNHPDAKGIAKEFGIRFAQFPVTSGNKAQQERRQIELLKKEKVELIVLARYHQILTQGFVNKFPHRIINIHHSFLPAFPGKNPYHRAYQKGVKIIGATSHFVTAELDEGPIIEQDTVRVSHRDSLEDFIRKGEDLEKAVLNEALRLALKRKILVYNNKTVVFD